MRKLSVLYIASLVIFVLFAFPGIAFAFEDSSEQAPDAIVSGEKALSVPEQAPDAFTDGGMILDIPEPASDAFLDTEKRPGILEQVSDTITDSEKVLLDNASAIRGLGAITAAYPLFGHNDEPHFLLAISDLGYLIMNREDGLVLEWAESASPYAGLEGAQKYYGGYGNYGVGSPAGVTDIITGSEVSGISEFTYNSDYYQYMPNWKPSTPSRSLGDGNITLLSAVAPVTKTLPYAYDYIQRLSFGNNTTGTCTAVATGQVLNYLDKTVDDNIVPVKFQSEPLGDTTVWSLTSYPGATAMHNYLTLACGMVIASFMGDVVVGVEIYRDTQPSVLLTGISVSYNLGPFVWGTVTSDIDKGLPSMVTTPPWESGDYSTHTMAVTGYRINSDGSQEYQIHNGWYGKAYIHNNAHDLAWITLSSPLCAYHFSFTSGWHTAGDGNKRYFNSDGTYKVGLVTVSGSKYYFGTNGAMLTGWQENGGLKYYFGTNGAALTGLQSIGSSKYYFGTDGVMRTDWQIVSGSKYYFGTDGVMRTGWQTIGGSKYYLGTDGVMKTGLQTISGSKYYFGSDGAMKTGLYTVSGSSYYFGSTGAALTGWQIINGNSLRHYSTDGVWLESPSFTYFTNKAPSLHRFSPKSAPTKAIEVPGGSSNNSAQLQLGAAAKVGDSPAQLFELVPTGEVSSGNRAWSYYIRNAASGKVLVPASAVPASGAAVTQQTLDGSERQKWIFESVDVSGNTASSWKIVPKSSPGLVLTVSGTALQLKARDGSNAQVFNYSWMPILSYQAHVATIGWQGVKTNGNTAGTTGKGLAIEALAIGIANNPAGSTAIQFNAHLADIGWQGLRYNGSIVGTTGQGRQMEAIQIKLSGEMANSYDVTYRAHVADMGWLGWVKNGATAGTTGRGLSLQAIEIKLQYKGTFTVQADPGTVVPMGTEEGQGLAGG